jgi:glycosyltransferase involved in cell wall biosynthesis
MRTCVIVPALQAERTLAGVLDDLARELAALPVVVVDDGSTDATAEIGRARARIVVSHGANRGKGAALVTGLRWAASNGFDVALSVDADGQHPARSARAVLDGSPDQGALVLGVRSLERDGAPRSNRFGNGVSNYFLSRFLGRPLRDTQCGLRRYPVQGTLALGTRATGYAFEAEVLMRAVAIGMPIVETEVDVLYPNDRRSHFRLVRDPIRIIRSVVKTRFELRRHMPRAQ